MTFSDAIVSLFTVAIVFTSITVICVVAIYARIKTKDNAPLKELEERIKKLENTVHTEQNSRLENLEHIITNGSKEENLL